MAWHGQRYRLASSAVASALASSISGGGDAGGVTFPVSTRAVAVGNTVLVVHDSDSVAVEAQETYRAQYRAGTSADARDDLDLAGMGITTVAHLVALAGAL